MSTFQLGNAPCSWGKIENTADSGQQIGYAQMLDELAATGYTGTELGDWGYMPTAPSQLRAELAARNLQLIGSWVTVRLYDADYHQQGLERALKVARLLAEVGGEHCVINIGDDHSTVPSRLDNTGRIQPEHTLPDELWASYVAGASMVAEAVKQETGLRSCLHHHGSTYVETPAEIDTFLSLTDPDLLGICFDTGHYMLGGGDPVAGIRKHADRITLVHFKDFLPAVVARADEQGWNYQDLVGQGMFCELGQGSVDFAAVKQALEDIGYQGWLVVEQDVLPGMGTPKASAKRNRDYLASLGL